MDYAVSVKDITKKYKLYEDKWGPLKEIITKKRLHKEFLALKDVSLDFPKGEAIGVLGKNGSGKSTLLKIITGIADPTAGSIDVNGSLVFLDVSSGIDPELTGYDNIFMKGILLGYTKEDMLKKVDDIIEFSELGDYIHQPVKNYSSGMRAKLGFAISVNVDPDILIVDEALAVGDAMFREKCMRKMNTFKDQGKTIIFVSHDKNSVESFCSKAAWIHQGELITYGDSKQVGFVYNEFMSGRKSLEAIRSEIKFSHSIEDVQYKVDGNGLAVDISGYLYSQSGSSETSFELAIRDEHSGEEITVPIIRIPYKGTPGIPEDAGFKASVTEKDFPGFFTPGKFSFSARYKNEQGDWEEFRFWANQADVTCIDDLSSSQPSPFLYKLAAESNQLKLSIENHDKVQQQVNNIKISGNTVIVEGVAFVRGYETEKASDVEMMFELIHKNTFTKVIIPAEVGFTEEITENISFNPQGKLYNYSKFTVGIDVASLDPGIYECKMIFRMKKYPFHTMKNLVWASKQEEYPSAPETIGGREVEIQTATKYLQIKTI
ncbi:ABC transporter ATP-binding protein [Bacillus sp. B-jedd]|uniref:ABC transporter ATP-binding protein n=1 Tax=Bacillus sp. B-jedd TaxID=1476857 RepID=UPI0005156C34|nr:ABC transporter ATP-binding protein [Bacillus sp. B-jedd]CEG29088.1 polysaccharide ABC transporter ATP-binding protein [Bacillus sp. B-jedd]